VAVIVGRTLVVANAGDSRAVICRAGGLTEPLSFDHKPLQVSEIHLNPHWPNVFWQFHILLTHHHQ
jgi:serine/threonine protein phosphatase PrpC